MRHGFAAIAATLVLVGGCASGPPHTTATATATAPAPAPTRLSTADTSWVTRSALYELDVRDFSATGDLRGVIAELDRVAAVGANVVWLMPIHPIGEKNRKGTLGSPYSVRDYRAINPAYGTAADFRALMEAVHARGMKLIIDWVPNHTAWDHVWVDASPEFYVRDSLGRMTVPRDEQGRLTDWTDVAQLDYGNAGLRRAMIDAMRYWLVEFGIDGFRVDVAGFVPAAFWREALPALRASVPRPILLLAEWGDLAMHDLGFDLTYAWDSYSRLKGVWRGAPAATFVRQEIAELQQMPAGGMRMRFTTNHDETGWDQPPVTLFGGSAGARAAYVAMALLPGRPLIYSGQEVESPQKLALFERDTIAWDQPDAAAARSFYRQIVRLARTHQALLAQDLREIETTAPDDVIAYGRGSLIVLINTRSGERRPSVPGLGDGCRRDLLSDARVCGGTVTLPPHGAMVLARP